MNHEEVCVELVGMHGVHAVRRAGIDTCKRHVRRSMQRADGQDSLVSTTTRPRPRGRL